MGGIETVDKRKIHYNGYFDMDELYQLLRDIVGQDYRYAIYEEEYSRDMDEGEAKIDWRCERKETDFIRYRIDITVYVSNLSKGKVKKGGREVRLEQGDIEIHFTAYLESDYMVRWETSAWLKLLKGIYQKYLVKSSYENHQEQVAQDLWSIVDEVKGFFQIQG